MPSEDWTKCMRYMQGRGDLSSYTNATMRQNSHSQKPSNRLEPPPNEIYEVAWVRIASMHIHGKKGKIKK